MKFFQSFTSDEKVFCGQDLAAYTGAEEMLIGIILKIQTFQTRSTADSPFGLVEWMMRALACMGIFGEAGESRWTSNEISEKLAEPTFGTFTMGL